MGKIWVTALYDSRFRFSDGAQNKSGKVQANNVAMQLIRQKVNNFTRLSLFDFYLDFIKETT